MRGEAKALPPLAVFCQEETEGSTGVGEEETRSLDDQVEVAEISSLPPNAMRPIEKKEDPCRDVEEAVVTPAKVNTHTSLAASVPSMIFIMSS